MVEYIETHTVFWFFYGFIIEVIRGSLSTEGKAQRLVADFFSEWGDLERMLTTLGEKTTGKPIRWFSIKKYSKELLEKGLDEKFFSVFKSIREFRNKLAHGLIKPNAKELEKNILDMKDVKKILLEFDPELDK